MIRLVAVLAGQVIGMSADRRLDAADRAAPRLAGDGGRCEAGGGARHVGDRERERRQAAAIGAARQRRGVAAQQLREGLEKQALRRMRRIIIAGRRRANAARQSEEAAMLAGAIVEHAGSAAAGPQHGAQIPIPARQVRSTDQRALRQLEPCQPIAHHGDLEPLRPMGGAGESDMRLGQAERVDGAAFDERDRLEGLQGGAREGDEIRVAPVQQQRAGGIGHCHYPLMEAFEAGSAMDLGERSEGLWHGPRVRPCLSSVEACRFRHQAAQKRVIRGRTHACIFI
jgi:hypothetical protein